MATIVVVLLSLGVIVGFLALSVDVSELYMERRELQNAADASAYALAKACAEEPTACQPNPPGRHLPELINKNAVDGDHSFDATRYPAGQCGVNTRAGGSLPGCAAPVASELVDCPPRPGWLAAGVPYVQTYVQTQNDGNPLQQWFAAANGGNADNRVKACARVAYGSPGVAIVPVTFSMCEWRTNTSGGTDYWPYEPPYAPAGGSPLPPASKEVTLFLQDKNKASAKCPNFNGHDVPGGFGYIDATRCVAAVTVGGWVQIDTGNSTPCNFEDYVDRVIAIPIFSCVTRSGPRPVGPPGAGTACAEGAGNNTWYFIEGFAKFYISGYKVSGSKENASPVSGIVPCSGGNRCISGWFLDGVLRDFGSIQPTQPPGPFGAYLISAAG